MTEVFERLTKQYNRHLQEAEKTKAAIESLQAICEHDMKPSGNDSHYQYFTCSICGKKEKE